jgi:hypothetical protein
MFKKLLSLAVGVVASLNFSSCATDQAAKVRTDKPVTAGVWGIGYRPNASIGAVANLQGVVSKNTTYTHSDEQNKIKLGRAKLSTQTQYKTVTSKHFDLGVHAYPWQKSAFFYGVGVQSKERKTQFDSPNNDYTLENRSLSQVDLQDRVIGVGPAVGWDWIWPNGMSVMLDLGPRWEVSKSRSVKDSSNGKSINTLLRDASIKKLDESQTINILDPKLILGYSW